MNSDSSWQQRIMRNAGIFIRINHQRIYFTRSSLSGERREIFDLIPMLLHEDDSRLPGNTDCGCPLSGVMSFSYTPPIKTLVSKHFPFYSPPRRAKPRLPIKFLALIGSSGTIAFTSSSDMDFWVGVNRAEHDEDALYLFREKLAALEKWALERTGLEIHFFIADPVQIRAQKYGELTHDSCGTALGKLLVDEFYRTAIFLAGQLPYYWLMPAGTSDTKYARYVAALQIEPSFPREHYVDLGNVGTINHAEYFGAALWQMLKGLHSPFKSALKMALLDKYSAAPQSTPPLCEQYKKSLFDNSSGLQSDPYLFLIEVLRSYYDTSGLTRVRKLIELCFIVHSLLGADSAPLADKARIQYFFHRARKWGWSQDKIRTFASYRSWNATRRHMLHTSIINYLIHTYRRIRTRTHSSDMYISDRDLAIAGKKIKCFIENRPGKVPYELSLIRSNDIRIIEFSPLISTKAQAGWRVGLRIKGASDRGYQLSRILPNPVVACAWCSLNRFFSGTQTLRIHGKTGLRKDDAVDIICTCNEFFPKDRTNALHAAELLQPPHITHCYIIPNWNDPDWDMGIKQVLVLMRNTIDEFLFEQHEDTDQQEWLVNHVLLELVGPEFLKSLWWSVHVAKGEIGSTRAISARLTRTINNAIERYGKD